ncbi:benzoate/H(+) symporter BenE family transporter [Stutzerimonas xanthomarina]|uniref:Benzoate membrane transport protein n=2 Tax=Stutzerimonas xanthomarina TaxID=271420 RepID=A0A1M5MFK5_9GAMM|nr:benzoate/H(+) symporter BenE family transporter [Stutzerimonas xanthomarina]MCP9338977.1 benzoate/H(+) symporter BenE family transporter [Stutzerimonas xanthomarina]SEH89974.1 benzoate membrane transport protein [Stutzerimonas xanthomarina]SHG76194.1 benzoate membrane transport protein [Stutzerimonas xanthomarina DSM 18231]
MNRLLRDISLSAVIAGFIATVISYAGPLVIIFQAAEAGGLPREVVSSWVWTVSIGSGVLGIVLSLRYKVPIIIAWSAPGSALLVTMLPDISMNQAVGAYLVSSVIILLVGLSGAFDKIIRRVPAAISAAMLAGILFRFGTGLFVSVKEQPWLVLAMLGTYLLFKRVMPRYAVMAVLIVGVAIAAGSGELRSEALVIGLATPVWITPEFSWQVILGVAFPLVMVSLTGQFVPGMAVLRNDGYQTPASPLISSSALGSLLLAPFGCHGLNLAAITAAICTGKESHEDPDKRYVAGISGGLFYLLLGIFGATLVSIFTAFPAALIAALAGLALLAAIGGALSTAMSVPEDREAALITFLVTASGMSLLGLSAAFWGLIFGIAAHVLLTPRRSQTPSPVSTPAPLEKEQPRAESIQ